MPHPYKSYCDNTIYQNMYKLQVRSSLLLSLLLSLLHENVCASVSLQIDFSKCRGAIAGSF